MPRTFVQRQNRLSNEISRLKRKEELTFNLRLGIVVAFFAVGTALVLIPGIGSEVGFLSLITILFIVLVQISQRLRRARLTHETLFAFYKRQEFRKRGHAVPADSVLQPPNVLNPESLFLARDLDLTGPLSIWNFISEVFTYDGAKLLQETLFNSHYVISQIQQQHEKIKKGLLISGFLRKFLVLGHVSSSDLKDLKEEAAKPSLSRWTPKQETAFWLLTLTWIAGLYELSRLAQHPDYNPVALWIFPLASLVSLGWFYSGVKEAEKLHLFLSRLLPVFKHVSKREYVKDLKIIENLPDSQLIKSIHNLERWLSCLSVNTHPLVALVLNILSPWNALFSKLSRQSFDKISDNLPLKLKALAELEVIASQVMLIKDHRAILPTITETKEVIFEDLRHPLGGPKFITNSFRLTVPQVVLITGSNMSGKSTFLRTIGCNQVLANAGFPVLAKSFSTSPIKLATCLRVSDSLQEGLSYFYAEVKRLKWVLDEASNGAMFFVDEIFKGTNNRERLIGSRDYIKRLSELSTMGFLTTHDLELAALEASLKNVSNWHFADRVSSDNLEFDYTIKQGPCQSTNALKIMKREGLPVTEPLTH